MENHLPDRIYRKEPLPDMEEIQNFINNSMAINAFDDLVNHINNHYNFEQEICFGGKKFGVMLRFRKSGKTLFCIFPEKQGFSVVLIYGKKEVEQFEMNKNKFSEYLVNIFDNTPQLHDGRWMLISLKDSSYLSELKQMIAIKKKPGKLK